MTMRYAWIIYGSLEQLTGGYIYDRYIVEGLRRQGHVVDVFSIEPGHVDDGWVARLERGAYDVVVGDELCHAELVPLFEALGCALELGSGLASAVPPRRVLLVHHLTSWERGESIETERRVLGLADRIVTTSRSTARRLRAERTVPARVPITVCLPGADRLSRLPRAERDDDAAVGPLQLLFVGTWTPRKGLQRLLEILLQLGDAPFELHVVGDQERAPEYATRVWKLLDECPSLRSRTRVYGRLSDLELAAVYARTDLLMLPSSYEGYGMVLTEALFAGLAVFASDVGATSEVVVHERDGLLLPVESTDVWVRSLSYVINDRSMLRRWIDAPRRLRRWTQTLARFSRCLELTSHARGNGEIRRGGGE